MPTLQLIAQIGLLVFAAALFLAPGWILGRMFGTPFGAVTSFLGSAALAFNLVLVLDLLAVPLGLRTVGCSFLAVTVALGWAAKRRGASLRIRLQAPALPLGTQWLWLIAPVLALSSIAARSLVEPLAGYDNSFRWDYLARLILSQHSLACYPPVRMADFDLYSWCDGIPPLVAFLNFFIYAASGKDAPELISLRALSEFLILSALTYRLARHLWGKGAGWCSVAVLSSCMLWVWGLSLEQETGLTAIGLVAMVCFLQQPMAAEEETGSSAYWAGVAAGVGAISREYGLYFIILGALTLLWQRRSRALFHFLGPAAAVASLWYARNWLKTGNPVYPAMGFIFPTNPVHVEMMQAIASFMSLRSSPIPIGSVPWILLATSGAVWILGLGGLIRLRFRALGIITSILLMVSLWIWSIPYTAGGVTYSMRVLLPALVLGSALAGWISCLGNQVRVAMAVFLALLSVDSARRAWLLPDAPFASPWTLSFDPWRAFKAQDALLRRRNIWPILAKVAAGGYILVDNPQPFLATLAAGGHPTPFFSPRAAPLFDPSLSTEQAVQKLRAMNVRFVTFSLGNPTSHALVEHYTSLRLLAEDYTPTADLKGLLIFDLEFLGSSKNTPEKSH